MKHKLIVLIIVIIGLMGFGALLKSPPSIMDVMSGASPKVQKENQETAKLKGKYIFCIHSSTKSLSNQTRREDLISFVKGNKDTKSMNEKFAFTLYVSETDYALNQYAENLCEALRENGIEMNIKTFSNTMLQSRIINGKYEAFIAEEDLMDVKKLDDVDYVVLDSSEMR